MAWDRSKIEDLQGGVKEGNYQLACSHTRRIPLGDALKGRHQYPGDGLLQAPDLSVMLRDGPVVSLRALWL